jgi:hypothetical protein
VGTPTRIQWVHLHAFLGRIFSKNANILNKVITNYLSQQDKSENNQTHHKKKIISKKVFHIVAIAINTLSVFAGGLGQPHPQHL